MNREQYQAKRAWMRGIQRDRCASRPAAPSDETSSPPTISPAPSLADHYRSFHACAQAESPESDAQVSPIPGAYRVF